MHNMVAETGEGGTGGWSLGYWDTTGGFARFAVTIPAGVTGASTLRFRVAAPGLSTRALLIDGAAQPVVTIPATGGWNTWAIIETPATLTAGPHTVEMRMNTGNSGAMNIDNLTVITNTTTVTLPTTTVATPTTTTTVPPGGTGPYWSETPFAKPAGQGGWHPWWGSSNLAATTGIAITDNAERDAHTLNVPAGSYSLEIIGTTTNPVTIAPYFATTTNWANEKTGNGPGNHGQLWPQTLATGTNNSLLWSPITVTGPNSQLALRVTSSGPFNLANVKLREVPQATFTFDGQNAPSAVLPGQTVLITLTGWSSGHDAVEVVNSSGTVTAFPALTGEVTGSS
jgi:hypothetical protein